MLSAAERIAAALGTGSRGGEARADTCQARADTCQARGDRNDGGTTAHAGTIDRLLLPTPPSVRGAVEAHLRSRPVGSLHAELVADTDRHDAYARSRLALACCGTVNVELALARLPQVAVYRSSRLTSWYVRHVLHPSTPYATLPNIMSHRADGGGPRSAGTGACSAAAAGGSAAAAPVSRVAHIPELLFEACTAEAIADEAVRLLRDPREAEAQVAAAAAALRELVPRDAAGHELSPATVAARTLLRHLP